MAVYYDRIWYISAIDDIAWGFRNGKICCKGDGGLSNHHAIVIVSMGFFFKSRVFLCFLVDILSHWGRVSQIGLSDWIIVGSGNDGAKWMPCNYKLILDCAMLTGLFIYQPRGGLVGGGGGGGGGGSGGWWWINFTPRTDKKWHPLYSAGYEITCPFPYFNGATVWVWEWISNFIPHFTGHVITYPCRG